MGTLLSAAFSADADEGGSELEDGQARQFVTQYCTGCHSGDAPEAQLNLDTFNSPSDVASDIRKWHRIADRVERGEMPPIDSELPETSDRLAFAAWTRRTIRQASENDVVRPGPPRLRRLNRTEYANSVRDALGIQVDVGQALPSDGAGGEGFDNASETLFISPIHAEKYLDAAEQAVNYALADPQAKRHVVVQLPSEQLTLAEASQQNLQRVLRRLFRRPISAAEAAEYTEIVQAASADGDS
ncbi:MAG: DUF1587 domain-containing protein, partial [Planctomycetales bacterium]|nr:DUF1587 domain-containing protein [Planctomycetales bacterium]